MLDQSPHLLQQANAEAMAALVSSGQVQLQDPSFSGGMPMPMPDTSYLVPAIMDNGNAPIPIPPKLVSAGQSLPSPSSPPCFFLLQRREKGPMRDREPGC